MARLRWRSHRGEGSEAGETRDNGVRLEGNGTAANGWARPAGGGPAQVPGWLQLTGGWAWRLLVVGVVIYLAFRLASALRIVVLPFIAALLTTALLQPLTRRLRQAGLSALAATWCTLLVAVVVLAGAAALAATQTSADYQTLARELGNTVHDLQGWLAGPPFHFRQSGLEQLSNRILAWLTGFLSADARQRALGAGAAAWQALTYYVRGTIAVAAIHAVVIGVALWVMGVPLLAPL